MTTPIYFYKTDSLSNLKPNSLIALKLTGGLDFSLWVTDKTGIPYPLKDNTGGGGGTIEAIINTDGNLTITGTTTKTINVSSSLLLLINSALQAGDNISELVNDANYITLADIPAFVASDYDLEDFTNAGADPYAHLSDLSTGITNLDYIPSPTQGIVTSDTGSDATIPLADGTNAGLLEPSKYTILENTSGTNTGDQDLSGKQDNLVSGTNIKTIEGQSLLGSGNIDLAKSDVGLSNVDNTSDSNKPISTATQTALDGKQATLGFTSENIANKSDSYTTSSSTAYVSGKALVEGLGTKQNTLTNPVTGTGVGGQVSFWDGTNTQTGGNRLLWNNTNSYFEVNGNAPRFTLKNNLNNFSTYFTNDAYGDLFLKNHQDKTLAVFTNPVNSTDQPQMAIGKVSSIPVESQLYVYGGMNGANIDARGSIDRDEANIDLEGNDWETSPNSLGFSYFGSNSTAFGTMLGYPKNKLGIIRFQDTNYAIINSEKIGGISPIRFGINDIEIGNVNDKGFSYQSDFSSENISNPRWLTDKAYVDTKIPLSEKEQQTVWPPWVQMARFPIHKYPP